MDDGVWDPQHIDQNAVVANTTGPTCLIDVYGKRHIVFQVWFMCTMGKQGQLWELGISV